MSYPFLHSGLVPGKENSFLNPIASVWLKTSLINVCAVAPLVPLIRGWYLSIAKSAITLPTPERRYYTAFDAAWSSGGGLQMFRGSLPFFASIPICTGISLFSMIHFIMFVENNEDYGSLAIASSALIAQEVIVSPLRSQHVLSSTWSALNPTKAFERPRITLRSSFVPLRFFLPASMLVTSYPIVFPYSGRTQADPFHLPLLIAYGVSVYTLYELGFRDILKQNAEIRKVNFERPLVQALPLSKRVITYAGGMLSLLFIRTSFTALAAVMSNKHEQIPF